MLSFASLHTYFVTQLFFVSGFLCSHLQDLHMSTPPLHGTHLLEGKPLLKVQSGILPIGWSRVRCATV